MDSILPSSRLLTLLTMAMLLGLVVSLLGGCRDRTAAFTPSPALAETALTKALEAWHSGQPAGEIPNTKPAVHVTDNHKQRQRGLDTFRILGETKTRSGRAYAVELTLTSPEEKVKTEYIVVGIDPLWVFRREDYELLMHWDHRMPELPDESEKAETK